jgi:phosphatidylinositol alpha-1,6-mannosyltransferase
MRDTGILLITWNFPPRRGGVENLMAQLATGFRKNHSVFVVSAYAKGCEDGVMRAPCPGLISFGLYAICQGALLLRRDSAIRVVFGGSVLTAPLVYFLARVFRRRAIVQAHGLDVVYRSWIYQAFCVHWLKHCDAIIANSSFTATLVKDRGVSTDRIQVIPPGVDVSRFLPAPSPVQVREELGIDDRPIILFAGRLARRKGVKEFVQKCLPMIIRKVPRACFFIAGDNPTDSLAHRDDVLSEIQMSVREFGLNGHVRFWPDVSDDTLLKLYQICNVVVLPSLSSGTDVEGFGMVLLEAGAVGKPVVAFEVGGIPDAVENGTTGILALPGDYRRLAESIIRFLENHGLRFQTEERARRRIRESFGWEKITARYESVLLPA